MAEDWEAAVKPASRGIRMAMLGLDVFLMFIGTILIALGIQLNQLMRGSGREDRELPRVWTIGFLPITIGILGIVCLLAGSRRWVLVWLLVCLILGGGGYILLSLSTVLEPAAYGINIQIYGHCTGQDKVCTCVWEEDQGVVGVLDLPCSQVRHSTSLFIAIICLFVVSIATTIICVVLGSVYVCCLRFCAPSDLDECGLHTTVYGANMRQTSPEHMLFNPDYFLMTSREVIMKSQPGVSHQDGDGQHDIEMNGAPAGGAPAGVAEPEDGDGGGGGDSGG